MSAVSTSTIHTGLPVSLSICCTSRSRVDRSKSRCGPTLSTYAPWKNTSANRTGIRVSWSAIATALQVVGTGWDNYGTGWYGCQEAVGTVRSEPSEAAADD